MLALSYGGRTIRRPNQQQRKHYDAHCPGPSSHQDQGSDTKDSDGDTSYVEPESFLDDCKWIED